MEAARDQVGPGRVGQIGIGLAEGVGGQQRGALLPVLGLGVHLHPEGIEAVAAQQRAAPARHRVVLEGGREREGVLRVEVILVLRVGARGLGEARVEEDAADTGDMGQHPVEHAGAGLVPIEAEMDEVAQEPAALRDAERQGALHAAPRRIVGRPPAQIGDHVRVAAKPRPRTFGPTAS